MTVWRAWALSGSADGNPPSAQEEEAHEEQLRQQLSTAQRPFGQPSVTPSVHHDHPVTPEEACPEIERDRRQRVRRLQVQVCCAYK